MSEQKELNFTSVYEQRRSAGKNLIVRFDSNSRYGNELSTEFENIDQVCQYIDKDFQNLKDTYTKDKWYIKITDCIHGNDVEIYRTDKSGKNHCITYQIFSGQEDMENFYDRLCQKYENMEDYMLF